MNFAELLLVDGLIEFCLQRCGRLSVLHLCAKEASLGLLELLCPHLEQLAVVVRNEQLLLARIQLKLSPRQGLHNLLEFLRASFKLLRQMVDLLDRHNSFRHLCQCLVDFAVLSELSLSLGRHQFVLALLELRLKVHDFRQLFLKCKFKAGLGQLEVYV